MGLRAFLVACALSMAAAASAQPLPAATATASLTSTTCPGSGCVTLGVSGRASVALQVTGTWAGTLTIEGSVDGATYQALNVTATNGSSQVTTTTANGLWTGAAGGLASVRARMSVYTSGTVVVSLQAVEPGGGSSGGGGGGSDVTIHDPSVTTQKVAVNASGQMSITCANCSGSGASAVDNSAFVAGATSGAPAMGFYHSTIDTVTDGDTATVAIDSKRNQFEVLRDAAGNARGANVTAGNALVVDGSAAAATVTQKVNVVSSLQQAFGSLQSSATANGNGGQITTLGSGYGILELDIQCTGCAGGTTINFEGTGPDANYVPVFATQQGTNTIATSTTQAGNSVWTVNAAGLSFFRARISGYSAGTVTVDAVAQVDAYAPTTVNANVIGTVPVSGTFWQATQPVSGTVTANQGGTWTVQPGNTANTTAWKVDGSAVTQPVSGTVTTSPPANASTNVAQLAGTATSVNSGTKDAGTLRVVLATDQPALTNKLLVTPDSVALPANQSTNVNQFGGSAVVTGTGAGGAGIPRVTVSNDSNVLATQSGTWTVQPGNTANTTAWKVDGSAVTQPVSGTVTANEGGAPWSVIGTVNANAGTGTFSFAGTKTNNNAAPGATNDGVLPAVANAAAPSYTEGNQVSLSTDLAGALRVSGSSGGGVAQTQVRNVSNGWGDVGYTAGNLSMPVQDANLLSVLQQLLILQRTQNYIKGSLGNQIGSIGDALKVYPTTPQDPCMGANKGNVAISQTAGTRLVAGLPGMKIYICAARVVAGAAEIPSFTEGTGAVCATGAAAVSGSTTAANGESYAANGGFTQGNGAGTVMLTIKPGDDLCLAQNTGSRLAGNLTYVIAP